MVRSIRWRLQLWYAAVLVAVTAPAAGVTYAQSRAARFDQIDTRLRAGVAALDALLRPFPPHELDGAHPGPPPDRRQPARPPPPRPPRGARPARRRPAAARPARRPTAAARLRGRTAAAT